MNVLVIGYGVATGIFALILWWFSWRNRRRDEVAFGGPKFRPPSDRPLVPQVALHGRERGHGYLRFE